MCPEKFLAGWLLCDPLVAFSPGAGALDQFTAAAGVVAETGGAASHAAIIAREYGIPAVMAASGATKTLTDGEVILVDGIRGIVVRTEAGK